MCIQPTEPNPTGVLSCMLWFNFFFGLEIFKPLFSFVRDHYHNLTQRKTKIRKI